MLPLWFAFIQHRVTIMKGHRDIPLNGLFFEKAKNIHGRAFIKKFREMPKIIDQNQMRQMKYLEIWPTLTKLKPTYGEFGAEKIFLESEMN